MEILIGSKAYSARSTWPELVSNAALVMVSKWSTSSCTIDVLAPSKVNVAISGRDITSWITVHQPAEVLSVWH